MPIIQNKQNTQAVIRSTATETFNLADFTIGDETINSLHITQVYWTGPWTVARGANTILSLVQADNWIFDGVTALREGGDQSITVTPANSETGQTGTIIMVLKKQNTITDPNY